MKRETGFYWIMYKEGYEWQPAHYLNGPQHWWLLGENASFDDVEIFKIGERVEHK